MEIETTKMTSRGQVVIPQNIRRSKGINKGEQFIVYELNDSIILKRVKNLKASTIDDFEKTFSSMWQTAKSKRITTRAVAEEIADYRRAHA